MHYSTVTTKVGARQKTSPGQDGYLNYKKGDETMVLLYREREIEIAGVIQEEGDGAYITKAFYVDNGRPVPIDVLQELEHDYSIELNDYAHQQAVDWVESLADSYEDR